MSSLRYKLPLLALLILVLTGCAATRQGTGWAEVSTVGENILVAYNNHIALVDPGTGRPIPLTDAEGNDREGSNGQALRWQLNADDAQFYTEPFLVEDDSFVVADYNNRLLRVNTRLAELEPRIETELPGHVIANPVLADNLLIVPFTEHDVAAYEADTYDEVWRFETERGVWASPIVIEDTVYIPSMDHHLYAVDLATGNLQWELDLGGAVAAAPLYHDGHFYMGTFTHEVLKVSLEERAIVAEYGTANWVWNTPVLFDDILYTADLSGFVYALDPDDLSEVWDPVRVGSRGIRPSPIVTEQYVIVGDRGGRVYWIDRASREVIDELTKEAGGEILSDMVVVEREIARQGEINTEQLVIVSTVRDSSLLVAYTIDGEDRWTYDR